jgi:hypothetical protein
VVQQRDADLAGHVDGGHGLGQRGADAAYCHGHFYARGDNAVNFGIYHWLGGAKRGTFSGRESPQQTTVPAARREFMVTLRSNRGAAILLAFLVATGPAFAETHVLSHGALRVEIEIATDHHAAEFGPRFDRTAVSDAA